MATPVSDPNTKVGKQLSSKNSAANFKQLQKYEQKKQKLLESYLKILQANKQDVQLQKDTSNLFRSVPAKKNRLDVRHFNRVISIDPINLTADIEGMATFEDIVSETLKFGTLPAVVPELKSITIGGALAGVAIESSSFRYGLVHETILEFELLLADGRVIVCRPDNEHRELFYGFPNTYGSLGYALKVKLKLIEAKRFVKLTHIHFQHSDDYFRWMKDLCLKNRNPYSPVSFIDGVIFNKNNFYITLGEFVNEAPFISDYKYMNIYYQSIRNKPHDYLTTSDYIWRWDSDWFWCSKNFFMQNYLMRLLFGKFILNSKAFWKIRNFFNKNKLAATVLKLFQGEMETIIQDIEVPIEKADEFLQFFQKEINIKPIWICPIMPYKKDIHYSFYKMDPYRLYINFGFWDVLPKRKGEAKGFYNRKIEQKVKDLNGLKSLYSDIYYTPNEFWENYDQKLYMKLKNEYDPKAYLKNIYQKLQIKG